MEAFQLWYAYYDSIFTSFPIQIPYTLLNSINISQNLSISWPQTKKVPELTNCFDILQRFIRNQKNWMKCNCQPAMLQQIQTKINFILTLLLIQKSYGKDYWSTYKRRIQASITHFFIILKQFVLGLIPAEFSSLSEALIEGNSCTNLSNLQTLVNQLLLKMQKLRQFILGKQFKEERNLVNQFLLELKDFLQNLPFYTKKKLQSIPQLVKYIQIVNPIQLSKDSYHIKLKRKKANTYANNRQSLKGKSRQDFSNNRISLKSLCQNRSLDFRRCKSSSREIESSNYYTDQIGIKHKRNESSSLLTVFKFNQLIRKHSINYGKKKLTITTLNTKQQRDQSNQRIGSSTSQSKYDKLRSKQKSIKRLKASSITVRSKQSSQYMILHENIQKESQNQRKIIQNNKLRSAQTISSAFSTFKFNEFYNFMDGKPKKWGIVRDYVNKKIAKKKIKQLINQQLNP